MSIGLLFFFGVTTECNALIIDDFGEGAIIVSRVDENPTMAQQTGLDPNKVLGGEREILVGEFSTFIQTMTIDTVSEHMIFETDENTLGYLDLYYGTDSSPLNFDLRAYGSDAFLIDYMSGTNYFVIRLTSESEQSSLSINSSSVTEFFLPNGMTRAYLKSV